MNEKLRDRAKQKLRVTDAAGNETGETVERAKAHASPGVKHLAFIVFVVNPKSEFALHRRASSKVGEGKIDSPVSHVLAGETLEDAVHRCLQHEYGIKERLSIKNHGGFSYEKDYNDGTCENEYCLVLSVEYHGSVTPNRDEIDGKIIWMPAREAIEQSKSCPERFEAWFNLAIPVFEKSESSAPFL